MAMGLIHLLYKHMSSYNMNNLSLIEDNESSSQDVLLNLCIRIV